MTALRTQTLPSGGLVVWCPNLQGVQIQFDPNTASLWGKETEEWRRQRIIEEEHRLMKGAPHWVKVAEKGWAKEGKPWPWGGEGFFALTSAPVAP